LSGRSSATVGTACISGVPARITELEQLRRRHRKSRALRIRREIDAGEQDDVLRFYQRCEFVGGLLDRAVGGHGDDAVIGRVSGHEFSENRHDEGD
jgi:hypothetical protein